MEENVQAIDGVQPIAQEPSTGQSANDDLANKKYLKEKRLHIFFACAVCVKRRNGSCSRLFALLLYRLRQHTCGGGWNNVFGVQNIRRFERPDNGRYRRPYED